MYRSMLLGVTLSLIAGCDSSDKSKGTAARAQPTAAAPAEPAATGGPERDRVLAFCVSNMETMVECLDDQSFWDILGTLYVSSQPELADNPSAKDGWIEIMKDAAATLHREGQLDVNCEATLTHTRWPTAEQIAKVDGARSLSCSEFANAFGWMMFGEGVFHAER